jgi:hypothetical protein
MLNLCIYNFDTSTAGILNFIAQEKALFALRSLVWLNEENLFGLSKLIRDVPTSFGCLFLSPPYSVWHLFPFFNTNAEYTVRAL